jgi:hypothetical protein
MIQSQQVLEWMAEGKVETLLRALRLRFGAVPADVETTTDQDQLDRWFDAAIAASFLADFRQTAWL